MSSLSNQNTIVFKLGGSSLATSELIINAAKKISETHKTGKKIVVIVSAMGNTTNELMNLAFSVSPEPNRRELDMLISTGERVSMALMSMALQNQGVQAISFTGSQAGIMTSNNHNEAEIKELKPVRVIEALEQNKIVVIAGFQGVDPDTKEITTLGRGGSDITAIAFAGHLNANQCIFLKDVQGVFTCDPKIVPEAYHLSEIPHEFLHTLCYWGAKIIHHKCVQYAQEKGIEFYIGHSFYEDLPKTFVTKSANSRVFSITGFNEVLCFNSPSISDPLLKELKTFTPNLRLFSKQDQHFIFSPPQHYGYYKSVLSHSKEIKNLLTYSSVTLVTHKLSPQDHKKILDKMETSYLHHFSGTSCEHFVVLPDEKNKLLRELHSRLTKN